MQASTFSCTICCWIASTLLFISSFNNIFIASFCCLIDTKISNLCHNSGTKREESFLVDVLVCSQEINNYLQNSSPIQNISVSCLRDTPHSNLAKVLFRFFSSIYLHFFFI